MPHGNSDRDVHYISGLMKHRVPFIVRIGGLRSKGIELEREAQQQRAQDSLESLRSYLAYLLAKPLRN